MVLFKRKPKAEDQIIGTHDFELAEARRLLRTLSDEDIARIRSTKSLMRASKISNELDRVESAKKKAFEKKVAKPLKRVNECIEKVEAVKEKVKEAPDSQLLSLLSDYEKAVDEYEFALSQLRKVHPQAQSMCYDRPPASHEVDARLHWIGVRRKLWERKR